VLVAALLPAAAAAPQKGRSQPADALGAYKAAAAEYLATAQEAATKYAAAAQEAATVRLFLCVFGKAAGEQAGGVTALHAATGKLHATWF
jgi:hypothetical protein